MTRPYLRLLVDNTSTGDPQSPISEPSYPDRKKYLIDEMSLSWWENVSERLQHLVYLEYGWDGYRGLPVSFENAYFALKILEVVCFNNTPEPQIVPGSNGDLQIEWHINEIDIELHIIAPNNVHAWVNTPDNEEDGEEFVLTTNFQQILPAIKSLTEQAIDRPAAAG